MPQEPEKIQTDITSANPLDRRTTMKKLAAALLLLTMLAAGLSTVGCTLPFFEEESCAEQESEDEVPSKASRYTFEHNGKKYDLSKEFSGIKSVLEYGRCGNFIIVECRVNRPNKPYVIINTELEEIEDSVTGSAVAWHSHDLLTLVFAYWNEIYNYEGDFVSSFELDSNEYISKLEYSDDRETLFVTIESTYTSSSRTERIPLDAEKSEYTFLYDPLADDLSLTPGDNTFMRTKREKVTSSMIMYHMKYEPTDYTRPPLVYYVIHDLNLSREEVEYYYRNYDVTDEFIDALFCEDVEEAKSRLKYPLAFKIGNSVYHVYELMDLIAYNNLTPEIEAYIGSDEYNAVIHNIQKRLETTAYDEQSLIDFAYTGKVTTPDFSDMIYYQYSPYVSSILWIEGTFTEYFSLFPPTFELGTDSPALLYDLARNVKATREDIEKYFTARGLKNVPERIYEGLLTDDLSESMQLLKSKYAFYSDGNLYTISDVAGMISSGEFAFDPTDPSHDEVWLSLEEYFLSTDNNIFDTALQFIIERADAARTRENTN